MDGMPAAKPKIAKWSRGAENVKICAITWKEEAYGDGIHGITLAEMVEHFVKKTCRHQRLVKGVENEKDCK